ncbi:hypothetical protein PR048_021125 [Dryococelus australis]|uniref:Uncharacterized protein n=1 Tax=Dryococelus australis TaxID=614101 RepID=A0ABQ9GXC3_9NEOP|nr:hypothetical protein PR048_021125 [Dryococelus australis]
MHNICGQKAAWCGTSGNPWELTTSDSGSSDIAVPVIRSDATRDKQGDQCRREREREREERERERERERETSSKTEGVPLRQGLAQGNTERYGGEEVTAGHRSCSEPNALQPTTHINQNDTKTIEETEYDAMVLDLRMPRDDWHVVLVRLQIICLGPLDLSTSNNNPCSAAAKPFPDIRDIANPFLPTSMFNFPASAVTSPELHTPGDEGTASANLTPLAAPFAYLGILTLSQPLAPCVVVWRIALSRLVGKGSARRRLAPPIHQYGWHLSQGGEVGGGCWVERWVEEAGWGSGFEGEAISQPRHTYSWPSSPTAMKLSLLFVTLLIMLAACYASLPPAPENKQGTLFEGTADDLQPVECRVHCTLPLYGPWLPRRPLLAWHLSLQEVDHHTAASSARSSGSHCRNDLSPDMPASSGLHYLPALDNQPH